jgi:threonine aldolase
MFNRLFTDNLFFDIAKKENELAETLYYELKQLGVEFLAEQETNQIFPIFNTNIIEQLTKEIDCEIWNSDQDKTTVRFVTSFLSTTEDVVNAINIIKKLL